MDRAQFRDELLTDMEKSIFQHETREFRLLGCLTGVRIAGDLVSMEDYEKVLLERQAHELKLSEDDAPIETYWDYRCATVQIEYVYDVIKAAETLTNPNFREAISAKALIIAARILNRHNFE